MRVLSVVGNRPQFIKSAPLSAALAAAGIDEVVVHTGQHYDPELSQIFFDELGLAAPRYELDVRRSDPHAMVPGIRAAIEAEQPDWVVVYGDTNSTLAGAQAAGGVPVAHVEAGLRSYDLSMPEERNRIAVDRIATLLLCPDERSARQAADEGAPGRCEVVGDVMADAHRLFAPIALRRSDALRRIGVKPGTYALVTVHREANVAPARLARIVEGLGQIDDPIVFPVHPRTRAALATLGPLPFKPIDPLGFLDFTAVAAAARVIVTDSGGVQKEAYWHHVPCVTLRANTEWVDTVEAGANVLVDDEPSVIAAAADSARFPEGAPQLYGDGYASDRIVAALYPSRP
ncbi:MAG: UDP-N-acetylglucosamine 2-epimerase (non-hydrolyzing) [Actinomycetes bacterium]